MLESDPHPEESIAREHASIDPTFIGVDGEGAAHYWSYYDQRVIVVEDGAATCFDLDETPVENLGHWCEQVRDNREWAHDPHVSASMGDHFERALQA